jgi:hypothetical protein
MEWKEDPRDDESGRATYLHCQAEKVNDKANETDEKRKRSRDENRKRVCRGEAREINIAYSSLFSLRERVFSLRESRIYTALEFGSSRKLESEVRSGLG